MSAPLARLTASHVTKLFDGKTVVEDVSLTLEPHTITALLGESGAGKSTLLRLLAGLEDLDAGEIRISGQVLSTPHKTVPPERRKTGLIFQDFALFPHMTAGENVRFGLSHLPKPDGKAIAQRWLERMGLGERAHAYPHQLSGGEQQRVAIARALAPKPEAMLLDEPFSGLDPALRDEVADFTLGAVRESGLPALLVSHDAQAAMARADRIAIMRDGKLVQVGTPDEVYDHPVDAGVAAALGPVVTLSPGEIPDGLWPKRLPPGEALTYREEALVPHEAGKISAQVTSIRRIGADVRVIYECGGQHLPGRVASQNRPVLGDQVKLTLDPSASFVFKSPSSGRAQ
ncbi:MAG: ABC transporter ATP-binding protein [Hyphomonadaceae bacterium]|nr:ABC transporter ATP-binding protein [Hyphomonadaceae bacterium]